MLAKVLHTPTGGGLHLCDLRGSTGELGLKASGAEEYFGLIYIGDTSAFKKLVEADDAGYHGRRGCDQRFTLRWDQRA
ncbi:MAG: hypothetical protein U5N86_12170 [Planctomycetota bacterium]|nr:hypothetical protein [Planctomycetota bacterium]